MPQLRDWKNVLRKLANLPLFKSHFAWGPLNAFLLLAGVGVTTALLLWREILPGDIAVATGIAAIVLLAILQMARRWDNALAGIVVVAIALELLYPEYNAIPLMIGITLSVVISCSAQVVAHWDKAILLRLGEFRGLRGPGLFLMAPFLDRVEAIVDQRVRATDFRAERILTLDTVPVYIDAICFWLVWNAEKAVLEVEDYADAVILSAQTALKDAVGKAELTDVLSNRNRLGDQIQQTLDEKTNAWGITIQSIEIIDVVIPEGLEEAMSKRAQAERERQARIILSTAESEISEKFAAASEQYKDNPHALHLRAMNMIYEGIRSRGSMIIVPSSALDTMGLGSLSGLVALGKGELAESAPGQDEPEEEPGKE
jgi:regulator of protease activity HflC (stomatin/prohibitin superfamily)